MAKRRYRTQFSKFLLVRKTGSGQINEFSQRMPKSVMRRPEGLSSKERRPTNPSWGSVPPLLDHSRRSGDEPSLAKAKQSKDLLANNMEDILAEKQQA